MLSFIRYLPFSLTAFFFISSCKTAASSSHLQHEWGRTDLKGHELSCSEEAAGAYQEYVRLQLQNIAAGNPTVFSGELDPKKFCITPVEVDEIDAGSSWDGSLFINTGVLKATENDAQFAGVLAHEIAHITMKHGMTDFPEFVKTHPEHKAEGDTVQAAYAKAKAESEDWVKNKGNSDPAWKNYQEKLRSLLQKEWNRVQYSTSGKMMDCTTVAGLFIKDDEKKLREIVSNPTDFESGYCAKIDSELKAEHKIAALLSNWKETEADEVGFEFYVKAGWKAEEFGRFFENADKLSPDKKTGGCCERGDKDHPTDSWRAQNIRAEISRHRKDLGYSNGLVERYPERLLSLRKQYGY